MRPATTGATTRPEPSLTGFCPIGGWKIDTFFKEPVLNSPYEYPRRHWELDQEGRPTSRIINTRRRAQFVTPIPKPKKNRGMEARQQELRISGDDQEYDPTSIINEVRGSIDRWRALGPEQWQVTPETARLLVHWRSCSFGGIRPFFCQIEAVETLIWLTEVAPHRSEGKRLLGYLKKVNRDANLSRIALKLATGAGKTMVMAMIIAWQTVNAARRPGSSNFTRGFLIVTPGLTIRDRLRVLLPNDPDNYYKRRELLPDDLVPVMGQARIVITNYHAFNLKERIPLTKVTRALIAGRTGRKPGIRESEGQMMRRLMPELMAFKKILVINDEAHHCYRDKPPPDTEKLTGEDRKEAQRNNAAARLWISGLEAVTRKLGVLRVVDLSATPFFLAGSGYTEGALFPWTMSDFSLMDAIESGIVKLPRVPVADNVPGGPMPVYRDLWEHIRREMPKKGRGKAGELDPLALPPKLITAINVLYGHYEKTSSLWERAGGSVPPCFIIVCQNTAISKLVYDYISGFYQKTEEGGQTLVNGRLALFRNFDQDTDRPLPRPNTILVDSEQLESGESLDKNFRRMASDEIDRFRRDRIERTGDSRAGEDISDQELLREVMNTVGQPDRLGAQVRCVVSVSMLTEGWDATNVTHILGVRAFGTQLLCEQVIGRALRRQSYDLTDQGRLSTEYADIFGIPFDFTSQAVGAPPQPPRETLEVRALRPERDHLAIRFPRVIGYRVEPPGEKITARFTSDSTLRLTPELVGPARVVDSGIVGASVEMGLDHMKDMRTSSLVYHLTYHMMNTVFRKSGEPLPLHLFGALKSVVREWVENHLRCEGGTYPALLLHQGELIHTACSRINDAVRRSLEKERPVKAILDPYTPTGSTDWVRFVTTRTPLCYHTIGPPPKNPVNWVICDSEWEAEFCRVAESNPRVIAYTKNHNLGFEVPYRQGSGNRRYLPDFIVLVDDGFGGDNPLHLVVEIKGYRGEDAKEKRSAMETSWIPGVNTLGCYGRWAFGEFTDIHRMEGDFADKIAEQLEAAIHTQAAQNLTKT